MSHHRVLKGGGILAAAAILSFACGGGGGGGTTGGTQGTIKIGVELPLSGTEGSQGQPILKGVRYEEFQAYTHSMVLRLASGTMRYVDAWHEMSKLREQGLLPEQVLI